MNKLLQKIQWRIHRVNLKFNLLDLYLHDGDQCIGFSFCEVIKDYRTYSLLAFEFRLPNGAERKRFSITNWDILYLSTPIWSWVSSMDESILWGYTPSNWSHFWYKTFNKLYK